MVVKLIKFGILTTSRGFKALPARVRRKVTEKVTLASFRSTTKKRIVFIVLGEIIDPFNRFIVPASRGFFIKTDVAARNIRSGNITGPTLTTIIFATEDVAIDFAIQTVGSIIRKGQLIVSKLVESSSPVVDPTEFKISPTGSLGFLPGLTDFLKETVPSTAPVEDPTEFKISPTGILGFLAG